MGRFLNPDNSAFQNAVNSKIYIDKTGLLEYINSVMDTTEKYIWKVDYGRYADGLLQQGLQIQRDVFGPGNWKAGGF